MAIAKGYDGTVAPICRGWAALTRWLIDHVCTGADTQIKLICPECQALIAKSHVGKTDGAYCVQIRRPAECPGKSRFGDGDV
jgi:hypothetical protein